MVEERVVLAELVLPADNRHKIQRTKRRPANSSPRLASLNRPPVYRSSGSAFTAA